LSTTLDFEKVEDGSEYTIEDPKYGTKDYSFIAPPSVNG
jgi:hypothetical protein